MFWADKVVEEIIKSGAHKPYLVDDMKTPSGKIHVGALRGVVIHDLVYKVLKDRDVKVKYTYIFDNHDPMDGLPIYLPPEYEKYLGLPLYEVPSPEKGYSDYAEYYAKDFIDVFTKIGCEPKILWGRDIYERGEMNALIKECLDKADVIRNIYSELYKKEISKDWYPFEPYCPNCKKVSTTRVIAWDGKEVSIVCEVNKVEFTKGCGYEGKVSPFSSKGSMAGKLPWKVEWPAKWKVLGITIEGAGKDHMSAGGSHDLAKLVCQRVLKYPVPYPLAYEFFLLGGRKMSSSKGLGSSARDVLDLFEYTPELLRFLMVKTKMNQAINFDPATDTIKLIDDYFKASDAYYNKSNEDLARMFELSQIGTVQKTPKVQMSTLTQWVQMPNMEEEIKKEKLERWAHTARRWIEKYAPEEEKFVIQKEIPEQVKDLSVDQKKYLNALSDKLCNKNAEDFQTEIYELSKKLNVPSKDAFASIYISLLGKDHGPKAAWLILSLDKEFVEARFKEASM